LAKGGPALRHAQVGKEIFQHEANEVMQMMNSLQSSEMEPDDPQARAGRRSIGSLERASRRMDHSGIGWVSGVAVLGTVG
jgi:hypothetical protein